jgi:DNA-binding Lrp family transcriptional regulator
LRIDGLDKRLIARLCGDLPLEERPFRALAEELGSTEDEVIGRIRRLERDGVMRRLGAIVRHREAGIAGNAMAAWVVPDERADEIGEHVASLDEVTHCYLREAAPGWPYTLYAMIHARSEERCREVARAIAERFGVTDYVVLASRREFTKRSVEYFSESIGEQTDDDSETDSAHPGR